MSQLAVAVKANTHREAQLIGALLEAAGIPAVVEGGNLMDEWAVAQRLIGRVGTEVKVPEPLLEEALKVIEEAREAGQELTQLADEEIDPEEIDAENED